MDIFVRLKMAMQLSSALQRHERAVTVSSDGERSNFDRLKGHEKTLAANYKTSTWCKHIREAFTRKQLPNQFVVRYANVFCHSCTNELSNCTEETIGKIRKNLIVVQSHMFRQLVELYCKSNIEIIRYEKTGNESNYYNR